MKTLFKNSIAAFLLIASSGYCSAETVIGDVTPEEAKDMGVSILARKIGDARIKVSLEFKPQGKLDKFQLIELRMTSAGKPLVSAPLMASDPAKDSISTSFTVDPGSLHECEFWVYVDDVPPHIDVPLGDSAYRFKVKDFVDLEKIPKGAPHKKSIKAESGPRD